MTAPRATAPATRQRAVRAFVLGSVASGIVFCWTVTSGSFNLFAHQRFAGDFYDAQAHQLLRGHWNLPPELLGIEAFVRDHQAFMYFGPTPALFRLPVAAVTHAFDGRLTQLSMLIAFTVAMYFTGRLFFLLRDRVRGDVAWRTGETAWTGVTAFAVGTGTSLLFLGSKPAVYHEASLWGVALAIGGFVAVLEFMARPTRRGLGRASVLITLALLARLAVGAGPLITLGLVLVAAVAIRWRPARRDDAVGAFGVSSDVARFVVPLLVAMLLPVAIYSYINITKFETPLSVPWSAQAFSAVDANRRATLDANGGTLITTKAVPTTLLAYLRPDAVRVTSDFPWVSFPDGQAKRVGDVRFDRLEQPGSIPVTMPTISVLAIIGAAAALRRQRRRSGPPLAALRFPLVGAALAFVPTLTILYVAQRYIADLLPFLLLAGIAGIHLLLQASVTWRPAAARAIGVLLALSVGWSCWVGVALSYEYSRAFAPFTPEDVRASRISTQVDIAEILGTSPPSAESGRSLPETARREDLFILGDCDGLYWFGESGWVAVERTNATGRFRLDVELAARPPGTEATLIASGTEPSASRLIVRWLPDDEVAFAYTSSGQRDVVSPPVDRGPGRTHQLDLVNDGRVGEVLISDNGRTLIAATARGDTDEFIVGHTPGSKPFPGRLHNRPLTPETCRSVAGA